MADCSTPLELGQAASDRRAAHSSAEPRPAPPSSGHEGKGSREAFLWPTPPYASYPAPTEQTETLPCQIITGVRRSQV